MVSSVVSSMVVEDPASETSTLTPPVDDAEMSSDGGRLPTPQIRGSPYVRHHLDRTTPSVGGALLTSPQPPKEKQYKGTIGII